MPLLSLLLSLAGFALHSTSAEAQAIPATLRLCDGRSVSGTLAAIQSDVLSLVAGGKPHTIPLDELISIDLATAVSEHPAGTWLLLSNGDRAPLAPVDLVDDDLVCRWEFGGQRSNCRVPLEMVTGLMKPPLQAPQAASILQELSRRSFSDDALMLSDGTRLTGALDGVTDDAFRLETAVGIASVEASRVVAVAMNADLVQSPPATERAALVALQDGAWLTLQELTVAADGWLTGRTAFDAELTLPLSGIQQIALHGPRVIDLTQRPLVSVEAVPFVSRTSPPLLNRNVRGGWLQLGDRSYARGVGMTSGTSATFTLEPEDRRFQATVGLDDSVGDAGSVIIAVAVDGRRVFTSATLRGRDNPLTIGPLDVSGGSTLTLSVEFAEYGNIQDVADFCDPIILR